MSQNILKIVWSLKIQVIRHKVMPKKKQNRLSKTDLM